MIASRWACCCLGEEGRGEELGERRQGLGLGYKARVGERRARARARASIYGDRKKGGQVGLVACFSSAMNNKG